MDDQTKGLLANATTLAEAKLLVGRKLEQEEKEFFAKCKLKKRLDRKKGLSRAEKNRVTVAQRDREKSASTRNIGPIPPIKDIARRRACENDLAKFIMTYVGVGLSPFSEDHLRVIKRIENSIYQGGRFVEAVYRGFGKTTISNAAVVWALVYGHCQCVLLIRANSTLAGQAMDSLKGVLQSSTFCEDFPEITTPILALEGITHRAGAQLYEDRAGKPQLARLGWSGDELFMPDTDGAMSESGEWIPNKARGSAVVCAGITSSRIRGFQYRRQDGVIVRPDLAIIDDPQDEESAASPLQIAKRLNVINKGIIRGAGHGKAISIVMPCTVIEKDDMIDRLLDPKKYPAWQGERIAFVKSWSATHDDRWMGEYQDIRCTYDQDDPDDFIRARKDATAYYELHREEMDAGCVVSWEHGFDKERGEVSAIQHAYNALIDDGAEAFATEFQNQPLDPPEEEGQLTREIVLQRISDTAVRGVVPDDVHSLVSFIDVQKNCLFWLVLGARQDFTTHVIDYGCYPPQSKPNYTLRDLTQTIFTKHKNMGQEGAWTASLEHLTAQLLEKDYQKQTAGTLRIDRLLIDANDGNAADTVFAFCRNSKHGAILLPACGRAVPASGIPFNEYKSKPGDFVSPYNWRIPSVRGKKVARYIYSDVNYWKTFARSRILTATGDTGCIYLFGLEQNGQRASNAMISDHFTAEFSVRTSGRGRSVDEWKNRPNRENHYWDCLVGCMIAASNKGAVLGVTDGQVAGRRVQMKSRRDKLAMLGRVIA